MLQRSQASPRSFSSWWGPSTSSCPQTPRCAPGPSRGSWDGLCLPHALLTPVSPPVRDRVRRRVLPHIPLCVSVASQQGERHGRGQPGPGLPGGRSVDSLPAGAGLGAAGRCQLGSQQDGALGSGGAGWSRAAANRPEGKGLRELQGVTQEAQLVSGCWSRAPAWAFPSLSPCTSSPPPPSLVRILVVGVRAHPVKPGLRLQTPN